ncbi:MAG: MvaI/BcnI family restriction endonuclease [Phycisphaerales bacterium]
MPGTQHQPSERFPAELLSLEQVQGVLYRAGCRRLYVKELAWNHDSKRQIYLTTDLSAFNMFPNRVQYDPPMPVGLTSTRKTRNMDQGRIFGHLRFRWLTPDGASSTATDAKIIYYPQYPEVRLSGFLKGVTNVPSKYLREKSGEVYPNRLLFLGVTGDDAVVALLAVGHDNLRDQLRALAAYRVDAGLNAIPLLDPTEPTRLRMLRDLRAVHDKGWIAGKRLTGTGAVPYNSPNAVGYTLEAELGVTPNGENAPDHLGWEVKGHTVTRFGSTTNKAVTVFTPEPDRGLYRECGPLEFLRRWGYRDRLGTVDRVNFGGIHRVGRVTKLTGLCVKLPGFDPALPDRMAPDGMVALVTPEGELAAGWSFAKLIDCWRRKHAAAVYVPALKRTSASNVAFHYGPEVLVCEGTDFLQVLNAMQEGLLYLDPALKATDWSSGSPTIKRRNQFRIRMSDIPVLYRKTSTETLSSV